MAGEEWTTLTDFAVLPATSESRAALLAVVPLPRLLVLLSEGARMEVLCKCLEKILGSSDADSRQILKSNDGARMLPLGLGHPDELVRRTSVQVVAGLVGCDEDIAWLQEQDLILGLVCAISDTVLGVANVACSTLLKTVECKQGLAAVFSPECCQELAARIQNHSEAASVIRMRCLELVCRMWSVSADTAACCKALGAKEQLVAILEGNDILLQLNAVEILAYLPPSDIGQELLSQLLTTAEDSLGSGAVPARLLSCVASFVGQQEGMVSAPLQKRLCIIIAERLPHERPGSEGAVDMLSILAALCDTPRGLGALAQSEQLAAAVMHVAPNLRSQHQPSKLAALSLIVNAVRSSALACRADSSDAASAAAATLHQALAPLVPGLVKLSRTPIFEERVGALCSCRSIAMHQWGVQALFAQTDFLPFIIDRKEESSKRGLEEKYYVVKEALVHANIGEVIGLENQAILVAFAADGAYYTSKGAKDIAPQVATLGAS
mmetsp:Transcript_65763/g.106609  ORF Transcript_65763/g.106609 Transcript_65763/m.106609 type:complete len:495 (+) Transcript_65763:132-1616(+)